MIGLVAATAAGRRAADDLAAAWPQRVRRYSGPVREAVQQAWAQCEALVCFLAAGATVRLVADLVRDKRIDPAVVCVDEGRRYAIALLGGHAGGANLLAEQVAAVLGAEPVVTTASDAMDLLGLDQLGWPVEEDVAEVGRAILDGAPVRLLTDRTWPLPPIGESVAADHYGARYVLTISDRTDAYRAALRGGAAHAAVLRPPSLVVGVGASRGVGTAEVLSLVDAALAGAHLSPASVRHLATVDAKADEPGLQAIARERFWPLVTHPADALAQVQVPHPSEVVRAAVGTPSVAEAAALYRGDGGSAELVVPKTSSAMATVAVARHEPRGRLALVGIGPGARDLMTPRATAELRQAAVVVGLDQYVEQVRDLLRPGTRVLTSGLGDEEERSMTAAYLAGQGHAVALVASGDAGVYALAGPTLRAARRDIEVSTVPGVTAALAAAAVLGAPLTNDHAAISLSDLHTPISVILDRVRAAARGDFVVVFYNPRSRGREWQLAAALDVLREHRSPDTPVGVVREASRFAQRAEVTSLAAVDVTTVDMRCVVVVGCSGTRVVNGRMVTARGYRWDQ